MPNVPLPTDEASRGFVDEFAALHVPWGMQYTVGRVYAHLLLAERPAGLDDVAEALGLAKSGVSVATRALERAGLVRRLGERGSKRVRYAAVEGAAGLLAAKATLMGTVGEMLTRRAPAGLPPAVRARLGRHGAFYLEMRDAIERQLDLFAGRDVPAERSGA